jgi:hypothetical protein
MSDLAHEPLPSVSPVYPVWASNPYLAATLAESLQEDGYVVEFIPGEPLFVIVGSET